MSQPTVIEVVRRFLPAYLSRKPALSAGQRRAIWAMQACRTSELGGHVHACATCADAPRHYTYHSCNHKACPQCGRGATQQWVRRQDEKRVNAPHFMVTFTLPEELRGLFFGDEAKPAFDMLFKAAAQALSSVLERNRQLRITRSGCTLVLHTWNQQMLFHPHIHCIVPGAGLDAAGRYREVKNAAFLVKAEPLKAAYRRAFRALMEQHGWQCDPAVWRKDWAVNVQAFGDGRNAIKYLGAYVGRSVIGDCRILAISDSHVTFKWQDRAKGNLERLSTIEGTEFVRRYLRHVLPGGLHSVRYHGFHHPAAKKMRLKVMLMSGRSVDLSEMEQRACPAPRPAHEVKCPCCQQPMRRIGRLQPAWRMIDLRRPIPRQPRSPPPRPPPQSA